MPEPTPIALVVLSPSLRHSERSEESDTPLRINSAKNLSLRCRITHRTERPFAEFILSAAEGLRVTDCGEVDR